MTNQSLLKNAIRRTGDNVNFTAGKNLPTISTGLDSVRSYQFECRFVLPTTPTAGRRTGTSLQLTTAAKQVSPIGGATDDIVVDRLNDKVYYPGKFTPEPLTITFDNQLTAGTTPALWEWFTTTYNPLTGDGAQKAYAGSLRKAIRLEIVELDTNNQPVGIVGLYGVFPTGVKFSEKNYATNEFATIEVTFRYDFINYEQVATIDSALNAIGR